MVGRWNSGYTKSYMAERMSLTKSCFSCCSGWAVSEIATTGRV